MPEGYSTSEQLADLAEAKSVFRGGWGRNEARTMVAIGIDRRKYEKLFFSCVSAVDALVFVSPKIYVRARAFLKS